MVEWVLVQNFVQIFADASIWHHLTYQEAKINTLTNIHDNLSTIDNHANLVHILHDNIFSWENWLVILDMSPMSLTNHILLREQYITWLAYNSWAKQLRNAMYIIYLPTNYYESPQAHLNIPTPQQIEMLA